MKMKSYLLLFLSTMLVLFALPKSSVSVRSIGNNEQSKLIKSCSKSKFAIKRTCQKKCIKHQTHSEQQGASNIVSDCSQQAYGLLSVSAHNTLHNYQVRKTYVTANSFSYLSPDLASDTDPPQYS
jgi:hypothetical protein